jgi:hypothetical protein
MLAFLKPNMYAVGSSAKLLVWFVYVEFMGAARPALANATVAASAEERIAAL